jgi:hypothetical protein
MASLESCGDYFYLDTEGAENVPGDLNRTECNLSEERLPIQNRSSHKKCTAKGAVKTVMNR